MTSSNDLVLKLRDHLLICAICEDSYEDPRTLLCLHSFCLRCLERWSANKGAGENVQCPACRHVTDLTSLGGPEGLPKAFFLERLREIVEECRQCLLEPVQCSNCTVTTLCKACNVYLCGHCSEKHRQDQTTREHKTAAVAPESTTLSRERERTASNPKLSRSASIGDQTGTSRHSFFRRSRSSERGKGSRNREPEAATSAERDTRNSIDDQRLQSNRTGTVIPGRCSYLRNPRLKHTIRGSNRSVWGVATLSNRIYITSYCASTIEVYDMTSYDQLGSISVEGLKDPWDMVACPNQRSLYVCDWQSKCVFSIRPGDYDENEVIRTKWIQMEHRPRGISVSRDGNFVLVVCAGWKKETTSDSLRVYDVTSAKRPRASRKLRLAETGCVWRAVHDPTTDTFIVCHGGRWDRLHRVCRVNSEGNIQAVYGGDAGHGREQLNIPSSVFVDSHGQVLVADFSNSRVHLLHPNLGHQRILLSHSDGLDKPRRLCLDEERGLLYVGQENGDVKIFHVAEPRPPSSP